MKRKKYLLVICILCLFLAFLGFLLKKNSPVEDVHLAVVYKNLDGNNIVVNIWRKPNTDTAYFFLPSFVQMQNGSFQSRHEYVIGEHVVSDGSSTGFFEMDSCYKFIGACNKCNSINYLFFLRSENIGSIHLTCRQKTEEKKIHSDRNYKATVSASLYNYDGSLLYENNNVKINCRGNSTWRPPKKAYVLTLPQNARLMDMPEGKKWLLLANAFDESNIRNAIVLDFAENLGLAWTPKYDFVDVYLNGDYRGVYMLTEKIEIGSNRLNISSSEGGGYLLCMTSQNRIKARGVADYFMTKNNQPIEIVDQSSTIDSKEQLIALFQRMEDAIMLADTSKQDSVANYLDLDSWVKKYLIDEIFENGDGGVRSSYYYTYGVTDSSKIYGGPVWDYDMAMGNTYKNARPNTFLPLRTRASIYDYSPYYYKLYHNGDFFEKIKLTYKNQCVDLLDALVESGIDNKASRISAALRLNSIRWKSQFQENRDRVGSTVVSMEEIKSWLRARKSFLDSAWIYGVQYCLVSIEQETDGVFCTYAVIKGDLLSSVLDVIALGEMKHYYNTADGLDFESEKPIIEDMELRIRKTK